MEDIIHLNSIEQCNTLSGQETLHPLVTLIDLSKSKPVKPSRYYSGLYAIFLKNEKCNEIIYGRNHYDYQKGTLVFMAPGQVMEVGASDGRLYQPTGLVLNFHPDLILGTSLGQHIKEYSFFSYDVHEALHISEQEKQIVLDCFSKIRLEFERPVDKHSRKLIASNIELFLNYCMRFYDRQFITREHANKDLLVKFESMLDDYFQSDKPQTIGLPSVAFFADQLHISGKYFGDLIKKELGKSAQEYIQLKLISMAKEKIFDHSKSVSEIAYDLGFKYPQHFSRLFKQRTGMSPNEYRLLN